MKVLMRISIFIIIVIAGAYVYRQYVNRNMKGSEIGIRNKYGHRNYNRRDWDNAIQNQLPQKVNKGVPDLNGGPEALIRTRGHIASAAHVFYSSSNRALKQVSLTFDDGPDKYYTIQILDILKQNNIKGTFFIVGTRAQANPEIVSRIASEGHSIGNHSWDHPDLLRLSVDRVKEEVEKTEALLYKITGFNTSLFRPPYGAANEAVVNEISSLGYNIIDWSVDTRDWAKTPVPLIMNYVSKEIYPGGIILQHCAGGTNENLSNTVEALPQIINLLRSQGYSFVKIQDLLNIPAAK